jgi:hypothetical protein
MALTIEIIEKEDASYFKLYDLTVYGGLFSHLLVNQLSLTLSVEYNGDTYTYVPTGASLYEDMGIDATYINLCGDSLNSYFIVNPERLQNGSVVLNSDYFPDGYYEITLSLIYDSVAESDVSNQGFLAESYLMAAKLPLLIDPDNFDYEENRLQFLTIAMLRSATWCAELGRETEFYTLTTKINSFLDARSINEIWST